MIAMVPTGQWGNRRLLNGNHHNSNSNNGHHFSLLYYSTGGEPSSTGSMYHHQHLPHQYPIQQSRANAGSGEKQHSLPPGPAALLPWPSYYRLKSLPANPQGYAYYPQPQACNNPLHRHCCPLQHTVSIQCSICTTVTTTLHPLILVHHHPPSLSSLGCPDRQGIKL